MTSTAEFKRSVAEFLLSLPTVPYGSNERRAFVYHAGLPENILHQITFEGPAAVFVPNLVELLSNFGQLPDGRYALEAVLEAAREYVGESRQLEINSLLEEFKTYLQQKLTTQSFTRTQLNADSKVAQVTVIIERDIHEFTPNEQASFVFVLSRIINILPEQIRILHVAQGSILITLEMPEEGAQRLWSLFIGKDHSLTELRISKVEIKQVSDTTAPVVSILFLAADPTDATRLRLGEEVREIQEKLQLSRLREQFRLHQRMSVRPTDVSQALLDVQPDIVHFSGHGAPTGALYLENQIGEMKPVAPEALAALFALFANQVKVVILNACYSESQAQAIAEHVDVVIGMGREIGDRAAIAFAIGFYQALGAGRTVEEAYKLGCVQIRLQGIPEHLTPVLKSFGLKILKVLSRSGSGGRTKKGIRDDTGLDITTVSDQLDILKKNGYVSIERSNGERWAITALGQRLVEDLESRK